MTIFAFSRTGIECGGTYPSESVFRNGDRFQMVWVYAPTISAQVVNYQAFRYGLTERLVHNAMSHHSGAFPIDHSVTVGIDLSSPFPALMASRFGETLSETVGERSSNVYARAGMAALAGALVVHIAQPLAVVPPVAAVKRADRMSHSSLLAQIK